MSKLIKVIALVPSAERRIIIGRAREWIKSEPNNFRLADVIEAIGAIRPCFRDEILGWAHDFHPAYALAMSQAADQIPSFYRPFIYKVVRGFTTAQECRVVLEFLQIFSKISEDARGEIFGLQNSGDFGYFFESKYFQAPWGACRVLAMDAY